VKRSILLDTSILIWALNDDARLTRHLRSVISSPDADVRVSVVSAWEILVKFQVGKLTFDVPIEEVLARVLSGTIWQVMPVLSSHIHELLTLPLLHRDPFDRLLIAQARAEGMIFATADRDIQKYRIATIS